MLCATLLWNRLQWSLSLSVVGLLAKNIQFLPLTLLSDSATSEVKIKSAELSELNASSHVPDCLCLTYILALHHEVTYKLNHQLPISKYWGRSQKLRRLFFFIIYYVYCQNQNYINVHAWNFKCWPITCIVLNS